MHRIRQESIDKELFDVISGLEAMKRRGHHINAAILQLGG
jgi:hypothetical protein